MKVAYAALIFISSLMYNTTPAQVYIIPLWMDESSETNDDVAIDEFRNC